MKIKTSELEDELLDEAVAKCLGLKVWKSRGGWMVLSFDDHPEFCNEYNDSDSQRFCPTFYWAQGGLIIERECIAISCLHITGYTPNTWTARRPQRCSEEGPTPLVAAMRCYVASKLGDEVELTEEV